MIDNDPRYQIKAFSDWEKYKHLTQYSIKFENGEKLVMVVSHNETKESKLIPINSSTHFPFIKTLKMLRNKKCSIGYERYIRELNIICHDLIHPDMKIDESGIDFKKPVKRFDIADSLRYIYEIVPNFEAIITMKVDKSEHKGRSPYAVIPKNVKAFEEFSNIIGAINLLKDSKYLSNKMYCNFMNDTFDKYFLAYRQV